MSPAQSDEKEEAEPGAAPGAQLVAKALNLIDLIGLSPGRYRPQMLARELGLPRSTVYRILTVLQQRSMVRADVDQGGLHPGFRFLEYAPGVWPLGDLPLLAMAETRALSELTGETVFFAVRSGDEMLVVQLSDSLYPARAEAPLGARMPLHSTGPGRACLASLPPGERDQTIARLSLPALTSRTITDRVRLAAQLDLLRLRRYAIDDEETESGVRCVGAAAVDDDGATIGAFGVAGPAFRMTLERAHQLGAEVAAAADRLAATMRRRRPRVRSSGATEMAAPASDYRAAFGRSPVWDAFAGRLVWLDAYAPALTAFGAEASIDRVATFDAPATAMALLGPDRFFVATASGARLVGSGRAAPVWPNVAASLLAQARDACVVGEREILLSVAASPADDIRHGVYRVSAGGAALALELETPPAGFALAANGDDLFIACAETGDILTESLSRPATSRPRSLLRIDPIHGRPSALAIDSSNHLWVTLRDGWAIARIAPDGGDLRLLQLPVPRPTGLAFGGADGETLFIVSSRVDLTPQQIIDAPASGAVFILDRNRREKLLR